MQKKIIALAIAGLASTAAFAQSNVTIYGRADYGFMNRNHSGVENKAEFASGIAAGSRIGFKGVEDLGNGLKALFELEYGLAVDQTATGTTAATWLNRHSYVGLTGGFGTVVGGRLDGVRYGIYNQYDPFAGGTVGNFTQMTAQVDRADNAVAYISPKFAGLTLTLAYASNIAGPEGANVAPALGNRNDNRLNTIMLAYDNGPFSAKADYEQILTRGFNDDNKTWVGTFGASYDFGIVKVSGLYDIVKSDNKSALFSNFTADRANWMVGLRAPIGKFAIKANYGRTDDKTNANRDASKAAVGVDYALSKRTVVFADYGRINNNNGATFGISPAANGLAGGYGGNGFDLGIGHNF